MMVQEKTIARRFSLEDDFMNYKTDDLLYGFMRCLSTAKPIKNEKQPWQEYLLKSNFVKEKKTAAKVCDCTTRTVDNRLKALISAGLVKEDKIEIIKGDKTYSYDCYLFPFDYDGNFKLIDLRLLQYLVNTSNSQVIRVYLYLLNCSTMKEDYIFTITEIKKALGYSPNTKGNIETIIGDILKCLSKQGIIRYEDKWFEERDEATGKVVPTQRKVLKFVGTSYKECICGS